MCLTSTQTDSFFFSLSLSLAHIGRSWWVFRRVRRLGKCLWALRFSSGGFLTCFERIIKERICRPREQNSPSRRLKGFYNWVLMCCLPAWKTRRCGCCVCSETTFCPVCSESKLLTPQCAAHSLMRGRVLIQGNDHLSAWWVLQRALWLIYPVELIRTKATKQTVLRDVVSS